MHRFMNTAQNQYTQVISQVTGQRLALLHATLSTFAAAILFCIWILSVTLSCLWHSGLQQTGFPAISSVSFFSPDNLTQRITHALHLTSP